jgi:hypothetical protein
MSLIGSTKAGERALSLFANRELASVLAPGVFIVAELAYLALQLISPSSAVRVLGYFKGLSGTVGILLLLVASAVGFVAGYVIRELAFRLLGELEKIPAIRQRLITDTSERMDQYFEETLITECLENHPFLLAKLRPAGAGATNDAAASTTAVRRRTAGGGNIETRDYESFVYAKLWVRNYSSGLSVDSIELEINVLAAALAPSLLLAADILASVRPTWWIALTAIVALAVVWWTLLQSFFRLRRTERWEAVRNLIMDYAMRSAAGKYPQPATSEGPAEP